MWKYYFKMAWRNFRTNKLFSFLNLAGLSIAIAICIPLFLFVRSEVGFDRMYQHKDDIYRVNLKTVGGMGSTPGETWACVPNSVAPAMIKDIPDVRYAARMLKNGFGSPASLKIGHENFKEDNLYWCDPSLFNIFDFEFVMGDPKNPLKAVNDIVISQTEAKRLFGKQSPMGQVITVDNQQQLIVRGVYKDLPANSTIDCSMIANFQASGLSKNIYWSNASYETFCLLKNEANQEDVQRKLDQLVDKSVDKKDRWFGLEMQPLAKIHLYSQDVQDSYSVRIGDAKTVRNLAFLGFLILIIACINYMNLSTARSEKSSKEVGINKTLGASRSSMILRFYIDTAVIAALAIIVGLLLSFGSIYLFNYVTGKHIVINDILTWSTFYCLFILWIFISLLAGSYPAILLSGTSALQLMRKNFKTGGLDKILRKSLVVIQFSCSIILIISVMVIYQQMKFVSAKDLGYKPEGVIALNLSGIKSETSFSNFKHDLSSLPEVIDVAASQAAPGYGTSRRAVHKSVDDKGLPLNTCNADDHIVKTLGLTLIAGSTLPASIQKSDSTCYVLVNEKVVHYLNLKPDEAIGRKIDVGLGDNSIVIGVVRDFNYSSLKEPIGAYLYYKWRESPEPINILLLRINTGKLSQSLDKVASTFKDDLPDAAFDYQFLDTHLASLYSAEKVMEKSSVMFSVLAIFVSCLGLFGLSAFMAEQKVKEVGIRKVLGASVLSITRLLSREFLKLVLLAILIGIPFAIWLMNSWLQHFSYRITISWLVVATAVAAALVIAILTISYQAVNAARANPITSLKTE